MCVGTWVRWDGVGLRRHIFVLRVDVGALVKEYVDEAEIAYRCHRVEGGVAFLR